MRVLPRGEHQQNLFSIFRMTPGGYCHVFMGNFEKRMRGVWKSQMSVGALALILEMSHLFFAEEKAYLVMCPAENYKFSACALWQ